MPSIPLIDLFAGPGGLNEGFSRLRDRDGNRVFETVVSVEKDDFAHQTLELRALYRKLEDEGRLKHYYRYLRGDIPREELFTSAGVLAEMAQAEALKATLGESDTANFEIEEYIQRQLQKACAGDCVLIGGPPCQAYSLVGRARRSNQDIATFEADERHVLYREYLRIVKRFQPLAFVMENVPGLLSAKLKGAHVFEMICADLRDAGYTLHPITRTDSLTGLDNPRDFVVQAEDFGVPQARARVFLLGLRSDINVSPRALTPSSEPHVTVEQVLADLPKIRSRLSKEADSGQAWLAAITEPFERYSSLASLDDGFRNALFNRLGAMHANYPLGARAMPREKDGPQKLRDWFVDRHCDVVVNHNSRGHMRRDLLRYFYWSQYTAFHGRSPTISEVPHFLRPAHENVTGNATKLPFADRFRVQVKDRPSTTVVSHIAKDGHYYIHYQPRQCRSLSVREAARLQTFPDNYFFEGPVTEQYHQVGNAVPPYLAMQIAEVVHSMLLDRSTGQRPRNRSAIGAR